MLKTGMKLALAVALAFLLAGSFGTGRAVAKSVDDQNSADVRVMIMTKTGPAGSMVYDIIATNQGASYAANAAITVPFDPAALKLVDMRFSGTPGWLKEVGENALVIQIERLNSGNATTTATVYFAKLPGAPKDAGLKEPVTVKWADKAGGGHGVSNLPQLVAQSVYPLAVSDVPAPAAPAKQFTSNLFVPGEPVTFWCNMPDGGAYAMVIKNGSDAFTEDMLSTKSKDEKNYSEYVIADDNGSFIINLGTGDLAPGYHSVVAYGNWTGLTAEGAFEVK